ncbi:MAG: SDR family oxidoreductase [Cyclobacteriaceae bacterium]
MKEIFSLKDKSILITGASSGIGRQIAITSAAFGANITLIGRSSERLDQTVAEMEGTGHLAIRADLTRKDERALIPPEKKFDGVVFNAGVIEYLPVKFLTDEKITKVFETNFNSTVLLCQQLLRNKQVSRLGSLVFVSSISSKLGVPGTAMYASSKAAVSTFARVVASEVAAQGIRSNSICPGVIVTPMTDQAKTVTTAAAVDEQSKKYPLGYGSTVDVSGLVVFLLSDAAKWMTGTDLIFDGGLTLN